MSRKAVMRAILDACSFDAGAGALIGVSANDLRALLAHLDDENGSSLSGNCYCRSEL
jgi:hypothetical protein